MGSHTNGICARLTMFKTRGCRFTGHFHDSGATEYNMASVVTVKDSGDVLFTATVQGHVSGTARPPASPPFRVPVLL